MWYATGTVSQVQLCGVSVAHARNAQQPKAKREVGALIGLLARWAGFR